ncbi:MAG: transcriptional repressor LexA [Bacilli bacterium]|nr:transcriptional repressor LexA [Bacilli bacterium]MDD4282637.1 transcriptional repressor LexA [Bacilli bacterium]MDD4719074.1 transcriptional repressor LexA [Bacilli bacterium]
MRELTNRQNEILEYIKKYIVTNGYPPTVREIAKAVGVSSPATIHVHLGNLEEKGVIKKESTKNRAIELLVENEYLDKNEDIIKVPLLGKITAGSPIEAIENPDEYFSLPTYLIPNNKEVFTLLVVGESMINVGIYDGDIVIIERTTEVRNGNIVVAMTDEDEVTLKTYYKEKDHVRLQPENDHMEPIILNNVTILGKALGLYRKL